MEYSRLLIAIALSFLIFLLWSIAFSPKTKQEHPVQHQSQKHEIAPPSESPKSAPKMVPPAKTERAQPPAAAREIMIDTSLYRMGISERGAAVVNMVLKKYKQTAQKNSPGEELVPHSLSGGTALVAITGLGGELATGIYNSDQSKNLLTVRDKPVELRFKYRTKNNILVEKRYRFIPDSYLVDLAITVVNGSGKALHGTMSVALRDLSENIHSRYGFEGPSGLINGHLEQIKVKDIGHEKTMEGKINWVSIERLYFMDNLISKVPTEGKMVLTYQNNIVENRFAVPIGNINPDGQSTFGFRLFMGPKSITVLRAADHELDRAINFGWFDFIAKPCLWFMIFIHHFIPNYGVAIIILTLVTRLLFWPLASKSYKSMNAMRKLQPLIKEIREKYKDDKAKINQETMALYRTYKVNPLGGCLPMLIQLPVFFALYRMLYEAIELRHAPFIGWINDLSAPDRLFRFGVKIPFMEPPYGIPVLTLIMGATMVLQQKMSPAPGDPTQAKMMMLMPIVFTVIFINLPSGLVLYWLVSNLVSIAQQYYTQKKFT